MVKATLVKDVHIILLNNVKSYILNCEKVILIDAGFSPGDADTILKSLAELGKNPETLNYALSLIIT